MNILTSRIFPVRLNLFRKDTVGRSAAKSRFAVIEPLEARIAPASVAGLGTARQDASADWDSHGDHASHVFHTSLFDGDGLTFDATDGGSIVFEGGLIVHGDLVLTGAHSVNFLGAVEVTGRVVIAAGSSIVFGDLFSAGGGVSLAADEVDFLGGAGSATIGGSLALAGATAGLPVRLGFTADAAGSLDLTDADLAAISAAGGVQIGSLHETGSVLVDSAGFTGNVAIAGSDITVQVSLSAHGSHVALTANGTVRNDGVIDVSAKAGGAAGELSITGSRVGNFGTILALGSSSTARRRRCR